MSDYDLVVIGGGPAGQKAAVQAAKTGARVLLIERAKSAKREDIVNALAASTFSNHFMPYGDTKFVNGQNQGAMPLMTQVRGKDIKVIIPQQYREAEPVFPWKA